MKITVESVGTGVRLVWEIAEVESILSIPDWWTALELERAIHQCRLEIKDRVVIDTDKKT